jgi:hypothetical protein
MNHQLGEALLRLHGKASEWLKRSSVEEEAAWSEQAKVLESKTVCETDDEKREEKENGLRSLRELLDNLDNRLTEAYANLIFTYGLARIEARAESASLAAATAPMFVTEDAVHQLAFRAFAYRIDQARNGGPSRGPLPPEFLTLPQKHGESQPEDRLVRYKFDRLRSGVQILEPADEVDPYRKWTARLARTRIDRAIDSLYEITDPSELERQTRKLLEKQNAPDDGLKVLRAALKLFPRLPPSFSRSLLETTCGFVGRLPTVRNLRSRERARSKSLENMSSLDPLSEHYSEAKAAYDRQFRDLDRLHERVALMAIAARRAADGSDAALLQSVIRGLLQIIDAQGGEDIFHVLPILAGRCLQGLQRLHLRRDLEQLLPRLAALIKNQPRITFRRGGADENRIGSFRLLLNVGAGWLFLGRSDLAETSIDEARTWLFAPMPNRLPHEVAELTCHYVATLALFPAETALFPGIGPLGDGFSTNSHFSLVRLQIIDAVVRAVIHLACPDDDVDNYLAVSLN